MEILFGERGVSIHLILKKLEEYMVRLKLKEIRQCLKKYDANIVTLLMRYGQEGLLNKEITMFNQKKLCMNGTDGGDKVLEIFLSD